MFSNNKQCLAEKVPIDVCGVLWLWKIEGLDGYTCDMLFLCLMAAILFE